MSDEKSEAAGFFTRVWRGRPSRESVSRFWKYTFLLLALIFTIKVVFDGFSAYLARRGLDAELEAKKISSLEYLSVLARRERALIIDTVETRCLERNQLATFRVIDAATQKEIGEAYRESMALRDRLVEMLENLPPNHVEWGKFVDIKQLVADIRKFSFSFSAAMVDQVLKPADGIKKGDTDFQRTVKEIENWLTQDETAKKYFALLSKHRDAAESARKVLGKDSPYFHSIELLENRLKRLAEVRKQNQDKLGGGGYEDVMSRYALWSQALTGHVSDDPTLDEGAFQLSADNAQKLPQLDCDRFETYFQKVTGREISVNAMLAEKASLSARDPQSATMGPVHERGFWDRFDAKLSAVFASYRGMLVYFFTIPPIAQTLFVTLFLGALGALATNTLRLSRVGLWERQPEPPWGELLLSPLIGALAAFGIFLLGSTGLLFTGEPKSGGASTVLSPFFIGLLGFISGLVYDAAFGRVRGFAMRAFSGDGAISGATLEDAALADTLRAAKASYVAELVLKFGIGKRLAGEKEFTFLVPSDDAMMKLPMQVWKDISNGETRTKFENWFRHHHAVKRVTSTDVSTKGVTEIQAEDEKEFALAVDATDKTLSVEKIKVAQADITWGNGVVQIMSEELPEGTGPAPTAEKTAG
jgi:hypothetical protein